MLELKNIRKTFNAGTVNEKIALNGVDLTLQDGEFVTIIGGNGTGKSTTLNAVAGVFPIDSGSILIDGIDVTRLPEYKRAKYLGRVFQDPMTGTAGNMNIEENLALASRRGKSRTLRWAITSKEREFFRAKLATLGLGLEQRMTTKVGLLSGGQRQALTLIMAALEKPRLLLLDEHTAALDPKTAAKVLEQRVKTFAKDIHTKYVHVPETTEFGVMFVPVEGLYAELVRRGMVESLQTQYKVVLAGPTTMAALLNSLQMGFRTLAIQKRSSEVWQVLGAVKSEFETFGEALAQAQKRIELAGADLEKLVGVRTRQIQRKLRTVTALPQGGEAEDA